MDTVLITHRVKMKIIFTIHSSNGRRFSLWAILVQNVYLHRYLEDKVRPVSVIQPDSGYCHSSLSETNIYIHSVT